MKKAKNAFGEKLRELREKRKLGIKTAAPKAEVTYSYLSKIENGHKEPSMELISRLCSLYGADQEEMIALYGALPSDIKEIVQTNGKEVFDLLRKHFPLKKRGGTR